MTHNRLPIHHSSTASELEVPDSITSTQGAPDGFDHTDPDECELFRLATHIVQYDEALTEILVKVALRKAELSEAG